MIAAENFTKSMVHLDGGARIPVAEWNRPPVGKLPIELSLKSPVLGFGGISTDPEDWGMLPSALKCHFIAVGIPMNN